MEPMEVLHEIVAADRQARNAFEQARRENQDFDARLDIVRRELENNSMAQAEKDVAAAREKAETEAQSAMTGLEEQYRRELAALEERFQARREDVIERMFQMTVGAE